MNDNIIKNNLDKNLEVAVSQLGDGDKLAFMSASSIPRAIASEVLLAGGRELLIKHAGENYRLRITNKGKLILTK